jgi:transposase
MNDSTLGADRLAKLQAANRATRAKRKADGIKAVALLNAHLKTDLYQTPKAVAHWIKDVFAVEYTESGKTTLLHRLGYVYKKPKIVPGNADPQAQRASLEQYEKLKLEKAKRIRSTSWMPPIRSSTP